MEKTRLNAEQRLELLEWQMEHQIKLMKAVWELNKGREEAAFEDLEKLEYGVEYRLKVQEAYAQKNKTDYIQTTIKELEAILKQNREA